MSLSPQHTDSRMCLLELDACFTYTYTHIRKKKFLLKKKIKELKATIDWRVGKNLRQIYAESALTYDIYNELRGFKFVRNIFDSKIRTEFVLYSYA